MREKYRIGVFGEIEEVYINFFEGMVVLRQELIGDTWFFRIRNGSEDLTFSIHDNYWNKVQVDLRDNKIDDILGV
jgi:hypothetical protein